MVDGLVILLLAYLLVRGWLRGFVKEGFDLVGLLLGVVLAFRLGPVVGGVFRSLMGTSDEVSALFGGLAVLLAVGLLAAAGARLLSRHMRLPGLNMINRAGGAGLAALWGVFLATIILSVATALPSPAAVVGQLDGSTAVRLLTDQTGPAQRAFRAVSGDRIVEALINLDDVVGTRRVVGDETTVVTFPPADPARLSTSPAAAQTIFDLLNNARVEAGQGRLTWDPNLTLVARDHALDMYTQGFFSHTSPTTGTVGDRLEAAGVRYLVAGENLALASTPRAVHDGLISSPGHRANILADDFTEVGIAVISGPLGLMTVQVFSG